MPASILVAEDQADIRDLLVMNLKSAGYDVSAVGDGAAALASQTERPADLLVLDLMLPELDGLEVTKALRARGSSTPILMLTAKSTELDRVLGLELGADDYLTKPFSLAELLARVKALLRRADLLRAAQAASNAEPRALRNGELEILPAKRQVRIRGAAVDFAVSIRIGVERPRARSAFVTSRPSSPGIIRSRTSRSAGRSLWLASAAAPSPTAWTS